MLAYNNDRETFPSSIIAGMFNFQRGELLTVQSEEARQAPKVSFT